MDIADVPLHVLWHAGKFEALKALKTPLLHSEHTLMNKKNLTEQEEKATEFTTNAIARVARLRREAKTGSLRPPSKRRSFSRSRRKNAVVGGIHLRGDKRTLR